MATGRTDVPVEVFLDGVTHRVRRRDAATLLALMERVTGETAYMWGPSIVGFGEYHYRYDSGREGTTPAAAFSPRKAASTVYLVPGLTERPELLERPAHARGRLPLPEGPGRGRPRRTCRARARVVRVRAAAAAAAADAPGGRVARPAAEYVGVRASP